MIKPLLGWVDKCDRTLVAANITTLCPNRSSLENVRLNYDVFSGVQGEAREIVKHSETRA